MKHEFIISSRNEKALRHAWVLLSTDKFRAEAMVEGIKVTTETDLELFRFGAVCGTLMRLVPKSSFIVTMDGEEM